jgi:FkbM family methyltransferase
MIAELLQRPEFEDNPPVLLDIGAAGHLPTVWKEIAPYSICIAFDGDDREFDYIENKRKQYRKLIIVNKIVSVSGEDIDFYLTTFPQCSSTLMPDTKNLSNYAFAPFFDVQRTVKLPSVTLQTVLAENSIEYIDWFKTDTQGTDLRVIESLDTKLVNNVLAYDLEPGIIDAYEGEDKLYDVLKFFNKNDFFVLDASIKGSHRINLDSIKNRLTDEMIKNISQVLPQTPDWCEVCFFNSFENPNLPMRSYILGWIFATIKKQHGLAFEIAGKGYKKFNDAIFSNLMENAISTIKNSFVKEPVKLSFKHRVISFLHKF